MNKQMLILGAALATGLVATAEAGMKSGFSVVIDAGTANGYIGSTRNSPDSEAALSCTVSGFVNGGKHVLCIAQDDQGHYLSCGTSDPDIVAVAQAINGDSQLYFSADAAGFCTSLYVSNNSWAELKQP
jgi:hypothetical protein